MFAYLFLQGINVKPSHVRQLTRWFHGRNVMLNLLEYNPTSSTQIKKPAKQKMTAFKQQLERPGLEVAIRIPHGRNIKAACGQLTNKYNKKNK